jgi:uridine kinase
VVGDDPAPATTPEPPAVDETLSARLDALIRHRRHPRCLRLGLGGGSGSGKSTVAGLLVKALHPLTVEVVALDRFFKSAEQLPTYYSPTQGKHCPDYNQPGSLNLEEMVSYCRQYPAAAVHLLDGHFSLCYPEVRALMDLRLFVSAELEEMLERRTSRNLAAGYGGTREQILAYNRECVVPGYLGHIAPSRRHADLEIPNRGADAALRDELIGTLARKLRAALDGQHL